jgi:hypothetical protein
MRAAGVGRADPDRIVWIQSLRIECLQVLVRRYPSPLRRVAARGNGHWAGGYLARAEEWRLLGCTCSAKPLSVCSMPVRRCAARSWTPTMR